jgi:hypothetical protein
MPSIEDLWQEPAIELRQTAEVARLREALIQAIEMLQIMQQELQAAHDALAAQPPKGR